MEPNEKNKPAPIFLIGVAAIAIALISYFILLFFFPGFLDGLLTGKEAPVVPQ